MRLPVPNGERGPLVRFALVFCGLVVGWACLHDLYLISIEPRHFTEYHRPLLPIQHHGPLALQYATVATTGPGLVFGFLAWLACRAGPRRPVSLVRAARGFAIVMTLVEAGLVLLGAYARERFAQGLAPLYPPWAYPDETLGILVTQTINISAYLLAPLAGTLYLAGLFSPEPTTLPKKRPSYSARIQNHRVKFGIFTYRRACETLAPQFYLI